MNTLNDTLVNKAIETRRDSQARKIKGIYNSKHTCNKEGNWSVSCYRLQANTGNTRTFRLVVKDVEKLGKTLLR